MLAVTIHFCVPVTLEPEKSIRKANTGMLGIPLNRLKPERPWRNSELHLGSSIYSTMKLAGFLPSGNKRGQKGDDTHCRITNVPLALEFSACLITLGTRCTGGHNQLLSSTQLHVNASTASVPGSQKRELNRTNWLFTEFANLSTSRGLHAMSIILKTSGFNIQSS